MTYKKDSLKSAAGAGDPELSCKEEWHDKMLTTDKDMVAKPLQEIVYAYKLPAQYR